MTVRTLQNRSEWTLAGLFPNITDLPSTYPQHTSPRAKSTQDVPETIAVFRDQSVAAQIHGNDVISEYCSSMHAAVDDHDSVPDRH